MYAFNHLDHLWWMKDCGIPVITCMQLNGRFPWGKDWHAYDPVKNCFYAPDASGEVRKLAWTPTYTHLRAMLLFVRNLDQNLQERILKWMGPEPPLSKHPLLRPVWSRSWPALEQRRFYQWNAEENCFVKVF